MSLFFKKKRIVAGLLLLALLLSGCGAAAESAPPARESAAPEASAAPTPEPTPEPPRASLRISELMVKNRAMLRDEDGDFSDWIELENYGDTALSLEGFRVTDKAGAEGLALSGTLPAGGRLLVWASGKDRPEALHADFSLSAGETLRLIDAYGRVLSEAPCLSDTIDRAVALGEDGAYAESLYPTPGYPNTPAGYDAWQESLTEDSPLRITEVCVYNLGEIATWRLQSCDWVEIQNVSDGAVLLSDYCLSDDPDDYGLWRFPETKIMPGAIYLVRCDDLGTDGRTDPLCGFSLNSTAEQLYLSRTDGTLIDYASLRGIPFGGSYGRMKGEAGWFYFATPSPAGENSGGARRVSASPTLLSPDGVYNDVENVEVSLTAAGEIYYTLGDAAPTAESERYSEPFTLEKTTVVRAIAVEEGALPSRPAVFTYIINENHTLPVISLVADSKREFVWMYSAGSKMKELPATLSLYEEDGGFSVPCGVSMHGESSLTLAKKNMGIRFRSGYGQEMLYYDIYDGGVAGFRSLVLRAGQDYYATLIKNALAQNLCLQAGNHAVTGRSKFCVLYLNGEYMGIYNLMEKTNEQLYADVMGVSRESVEVIESQASGRDTIYQGLFNFCTHHDLSNPEYYEQVQQMVDIDSVIDWIVLEGYCANTDLTFGNVRYAHSTEGDGKWRLMFYDLDATFWDSTVAFTNMFDGLALYSRQVGNFLIRPLLQNPDFKDRMLRRTAELLDTVLSAENVTAEIHRLAAIIEPEVERDYTSHGMMVKKWENDMNFLLDKFVDDAWNKNCVNQICRMLQLTDEERAAYFGD